LIRFAGTLTLKQRQALGLPRFKPGSDSRKTPSYSAFYNLLRQLDREAFAPVMTGWLQQHEGTLPRKLAPDGKFIRAMGVAVMTVTLGRFWQGRAAGPSAAVSARPPHRPVHPLNVES